MKKRTCRLYWVSMLCLGIYTLSHAQTIDIDIDWSHHLRAIPEYAYGVNSPAHFIPAYSNDMEFMEKVELITQKKGMIRLHGWGMLGDSPEAWQIDGVWDAVKIQNALTPLMEQGYQVMINIPSGPAGEDDYQNPAAFAQFCADLVQIVNVDYHLGVKYWEIPNERESGFVTPGLSTLQMSNLIKTAALAMKAVDSTIQIGGAATAWVNIEYLTELVELTPEMDFISCHTYSGDCTNSLDDMYNVAQYAAEDLWMLRKALNANDPLQYIPIFLTEYNLSFQGCDYIQSHEGAVYDAIMMTEPLKAGIDATCYWNIAPYSDMSVIIGDELKENAHLFENFNKFFQGALVESYSSDSTKVLVYSTVDESTNNYAFCLINRTAVNQNVQVQTVGIVPDTLQRFLWSEQSSYLGDTTTWQDLANGNMSLPPLSVTMFRGNSSFVSVSNVSEMEKVASYPNPNTGLLHLLPENNGNSYQIISTVGTVLKSGVIKNNRIRMKAIPQGVYYIKIIDKKGSFQMITVMKE